MPRVGVADVALQAFNEMELSRSIGAQIVSADAPYIRYLQQINSQLKGQGSLHMLRALEARAKHVRDDLNRKDYTTAHTVPVLQVVDITHNNVIQEVASITLRELGGGIAVQARRRTETINQFISQMNSATNGVHTRVILLETGWTQKGILTGYYETGQAAAEMLFAHVLGQEFGLPPLDVARLCNFQQTRSLSSNEGGSYALRPTMDPFTATFGHQDLAAGGCLVQWVNRVRVGRESMFLVVARISESWTARDRPNGSMMDNHMRLPCQMPFGPPAQHSQAAQPSEPSYTGLQGIAETIGAYLAHGTTLQPGVPSFHWFAAITHLAYCALIRDYTTFQEDWQSMQKRDHQIGEELQLNTKVKKLRSAVMLTQIQIASFEEWLHNADPTDMMTVNSQLARLLVSIEHLVAEIDDSAESGIKLRGLEMNETSIKENKSAIALTILAYFFIPLNLASSIFGMNVQEINGTGMEISVFVIVALVALTVSLIGLFYWRVSTQRAKYKQKYERYEQKAVRARKNIHDQKRDMFGVLMRPWDRFYERRHGGPGIDF